MANVYEISDGGERHWIAAESEDQARDLWQELFGQHEPDSEIDGVKVLSDDTKLTISDAGDNGETLTKTAAEWAVSDIGNGLVGSTCW